MFAWCLPLLPFVYITMQNLATCKHPQAKYNVTPDYHRGKSKIKSQQRHCRGMREYGECGPDAKLFEKKTRRKNK